MVKVVEEWEMFFQVKGSYTKGRAILRVVSYYLFHVCPYDLSLELTSTVKICSVSICYFST